MDKIKNLLSKLKHPEVNNSLVELGMIGEIKKEGKQIKVELKLPMLEVPIKEMMADSIKNKLKNFEVKVEFSVMDNNEKNDFFNLAHKNWAR